MNDLIQLLPDAIANQIGRGFIAGHQQQGIAHGLEVEPHDVAGSRGDVVLPEGCQLEKPKAYIRSIGMILF
jgi:hypothetical protein